MVADCHGNGKQGSAIAGNCQADFHRNHPSVALETGVENCWQLPAIALPAIAKLISTATIGALPTLPPAWRPRRGARYLETPRGAGILHGVLDHPSDGLSPARIRGKRASGTHEVTLTLTLTLTLTPTPDSDPNPRLDVGVWGAGWSAWVRIRVRVRVRVRVRGVGQLLPLQAGVS